METPTFRSQIELEKYMDISVTSGEGLFNHNPSFYVLTQYYQWLLERSRDMTSRLVCENGKRILKLGEKEYEIESEVAKWIIHNTDIRVIYK